MPVASPVESREARLTASLEAEHEPHPGAGEDDEPDLRAEVEVGHLPGPEVETRPPRARSRARRALRASPVEHPPADLRRDDEAEEEVQEHGGAPDADFPSAICAYSLAKKNVGRKAIIAIPSTRFWTENGRIRKMPTWMISGDSVRDSTTANTARTARPTTHSQTPGLLQPQSLEPEDARRPRRSGRARGSRSARGTPSPAGDRDQRERDERHRDVHPEDRAPGPLREEAAEDRADQGRRRSRRRGERAAASGASGRRSRARPGTSARRRRPGARGTRSATPRRCRSGSAARTPRRARTRSRQSRPSACAPACRRGARRTESRESPARMRFLDPPPRRRIQPEAPAPHNLRRERRRRPRPRERRGDP